ncbi:MAG: DUF5723 family protein [Vicingaceae bacterium]
MRKYTLTTLLSLLFVQFTFAQQDFTLYNLNEVPQSNYSNPSNQFNGNWYIGLPALSSSYVSLSNSGFAYSDAVKQRSSDLLLDFNALINEIEDENYLSFHTKIDLLSFGIKLSERTQLNVNVSENASFKFSYPKDFIRFVYEGNASFEDNTANLNGIGINAIHYREYGIGVSHQFTQKLRLGLRAKYLYGMENIYSKTTDISIRTDPNTYAITATADIEIQTAGLDDVDFDEEGVSSYLTGRSNSGFAVDFGANYELNEKISLNASVLDLGFISWKDYTTTYSSKGQFEYSGIEIDAFGQGNTPGGETSFDRVGDSLEEAFDLDTSYAGYTAPLTGRIYLGGNYKLNDRSFAGVLIQSEVYRSSVRPSFTAHYNRKMNKWITLSGSYTIINRSYNNLGVGLILNPGPVQFYVVSDNLMGAFRPQHARHVQVRFGINLIFGSDKNTELRPNFRGVVESGKDRKSDKTNEDNSSDE